MIYILNKFKVLIFISVILIIIISGVLIYLNIDTKGEDYYIETFRKNKNLFDNISDSLIPIEYELSIFEESNKIVVKQNGIITGISKSLLDEVTKTNIKRAIKELDLKNIIKTKTYVRFTYYSNKDLYSIVRIADKKLLNSYTDVEELGEDWYYCFIFYE